MAASTTTSIAPPATTTRLATPSRPSDPRAIATMLGVALITIASQWMIAAVMFASAWGIDHFESIQVLGKVLAWEFTQLRLNNLDYWYFALSLSLAAGLGLLGKYKAE